MRALLLVALVLPGCFWIGPDRHAEALDPDSDGVAFPADCDDDDPERATVSEFFADLDGDGFGDAREAITACGPPDGYVTDDTDCDDRDAGVHPDAVEVCDPLGTDEDCDGLVNDADDSVQGTVTYYADLDGDGYGDAGAAMQACSAPSQHVSDAADCDDTDATVHPRGQEVCGGGDEDCDGLVDDADPSVAGTTVWFEDTDGDTFGDPDAATTACVAPPAAVADGRDCDDADPLVHPNATEECDPLFVDEDCDGEVNEDGTTTLTYSRDADGDGYGDAADQVQACALPAGYVLDDADCNDAHAGIHPGAAEHCDTDPVGIDEDCDGLVNDADTDNLQGPRYWTDGDGDGFGDPLSVPVVACTPPASGFADNDLDCNDGDNTISPLATEVCDPADVDEDCDGQADDLDGVAAGRVRYYTDGDGDGHGAGSASWIEACDPPGAGWSADALDCNDADPSVHPSAVEICDAADVDEDCDGLADDADPTVSTATFATLYADTDGDGYGDDLTTATACDPFGTFGRVGGDCNDSDPTIHPDATEICDPGDVDEDCDGSADDADPSAVGQTAWHPDGDGDGYGDANSVVWQCDAGALLATGTDCDDSTNAIHPGQNEVCDPLDVDEDCNGVADDDDGGVTGTTTYYGDADGDGFGAPGLALEACELPLGFATTDTDCRDDLPGVNPSATEVCDPLDIDEDCNGLVDDADAHDPLSELPFYADADGDGFGAGGAVGTACSPPDGFALTATDCDDLHASANPAGTEACDPDDVDEDCDGAADDADTAAIGRTRQWPDTDDDGYGDMFHAGALACDHGVNWVQDNTDCDDTVQSTNPGAIEFSDDAVDSDCDGTNTLCGGGVFRVPVPVPNIQLAVDAACDFDVVWISPGTYVENVDMTGKDIRLDRDPSTSGPVIVDGSGSPGTPVVTMNAGELDDLTLRNGSAVDGGCLHISNNPGGTRIEDTELDTCTASGDGGAVWVGGTPTWAIFDNIWAHDSGAGGRGGCVFLDGLGLDVDLRDSTLERCTATGSGGGLAATTDVDVDVDDTDVLLGQAGGNGGGLWCDGCTDMDVHSGSSLMTNTATGLGGGAYMANTSSPGHSVDLANIVVQGNTAASGGGLYLDNSAWNFDLIDTRFEANRALSGPGGGVWARDVIDFDTDNATYRANTATRGGGIYLERVGGGWDTVWLDGNTASAGEAGMYSASLADASEFSVLELVASGNSGPGTTVLLSGGAAGGGVFAANVLAYDNTAVGGGAALELAAATGELLHLENATIANNGASGDAGILINGSGGAVEILNAIVAFNGGTGIRNLGLPTPSVGFSDVFGNADGGYAGMTDPTGSGGNIALNPVFVDVLGRDYHLNTGSPCTDAGDPGLSDPDTTRSDMGHYGGPFAP